MKFTCMMMCLCRPRIKHPNLDNVYRVGASIRPGNGVPLVMIGARLAAEQVLRDVQVESFGREYSSSSSSSSTVGSQ